MEWLPLRVWQDIYREALSLLRSTFFPATRKPHKRRRATRTGRPLYRIAGIESLEPRMDVATFGFDSVAGLMHVGDGKTDYKFPKELNGTGFTLYCYSSNGSDFYVISDTTGDVVHRCPYEGGQNKFGGSANGHTYRGSVTDPATNEKTTYFYDAQTKSLVIKVYNEKGVKIREKKIEPPKDPLKLPWPWEVDACTR